MIVNIGLNLHRLFTKIFQFIFEWKKTDWQLLEV